MLKKKNIAVTCVSELAISEYPVADTLESTPQVVLDTSEEGVSLLNMIEADRNYSEIIPHDGEWYKVPEEAQVPVKTWIKEKLPTEVLIQVRQVIGKISAELGTEACAFVMRDNDSGEYFVVCPEYQDLQGAFYTVEIPAIKRMFMHYPNAVIVGEFHSHPFGVAPGMFSGPDQASTEKMNGRYYGNITFSPSSNEFGGVNVRLSGVKKFLDPKDAFTNGVPDMHWRLTETAEEALDELTLEHINTVIERHKEVKDARVAAEQAALKRTGGSWLHRIIGGHKKKYKRKSFKQPTNALLVPATGGYTANAIKPKAAVVKSYAEAIEGSDGRFFFRNDVDVVDCAFVPNSLDVMELRTKLEAEMGLSRFGNAGVELLTAVRKILVVNGVKILVHIHKGDSKLEMSGETAPIGLALMERDELERKVELTLYIDIMASTFSAYTLIPGTSKYLDKNLRIDHTTLFRNVNGAHRAFLKQSPLEDKGYKLFHAPRYTGYTGNYQNNYRGYRTAWEQYAGVDMFDSIGAGRTSPHTTAPALRTATTPAPKIAELEPIKSVVKSHVDGDAIDSVVANLIGIAESCVNDEKLSIDKLTLDAAEEHMETLFEIEASFVEEYIEEMADIMPATGEAKPVEDYTAQFYPVSLSVVDDAIERYAVPEFDATEQVHAVAIDILFIEAVAGVMAQNSWAAKDIPTEVYAELVAMYEANLMEVDIYEKYSVGAEGIDPKVVSYGTVYNLAMHYAIHPGVEALIKQTQYLRPWSAVEKVMNDNMLKVAGMLYTHYSTDSEAVIAPPALTTNLVKPIPRPLIEEFADELEIHTIADAMYAANILLTVAIICRLLDTAAHDVSARGALVGWKDRLQVLFDKNTVLAQGVAEKGQSKTEEAE